jgi:hypothetical protein
MMRFLRKIKFATFSRAMNKRPLTLLKAMPALLAKLV